VVNGKVKLGWVTTWNTKCGIASYSSYLLHNLATAYDLRILASRMDYPFYEDGPEVIRCWECNAVEHLNDLEDAINQNDLEVIVVQFQFAFFHLPALGKLLKKLHSRGTKVIIMFHATKDVGKPYIKASLSQIKDSLGLVDRLLVHGDDDLCRLQGLGLSHNSEIFPQGVHDFGDQDIEALRSRLGIRGRPVLTTYGFLLPHKGILEMIEAFPSILKKHPGATLLLVNALHPRSPKRNYGEQCLSRIESLGMKNRIRFIDDYLDDDESLCLLACADLIVYPYQRTPESSSAAVRFGLASHRAIAVTPLDIFQDVRDLCHVLPGTSPAEIASGILHVLSDPQEFDAWREIRQYWLRTHSWKVLAGRLDAMIQTLVRNAASSEKSIDPDVSKRRVA